MIRFAKIISKYGLYMIG